eukprot:jgi/Mesen1/10663/ME000009S10463
MDAQETGASPPYTCREGTEELGRAGASGEGASAEGEKEALEGGRSTVLLVKGKRRKRKAAVTFAPVPAAAAATGLEGYAGTSRQEAETQLPLILEGQVQVQVKSKEEGGEEEEEGEKGKSAGGDERSPPLPLPRAVEGRGAPGPGAQPTQPRQTQPGELKVKVKRKKRTRDQQEEDREAGAIQRARERGQEAAPAGDPQKRLRLTAKGGGKKKERAPGRQPAGMALLAKPLPEALAARQKHAHPAPSSAHTFGPFGRNRACLKAPQFAFLSPESQEAVAAAEEEARRRQAQMEALCGRLQASARARARTEGSRCPTAASASKLSATDISELFRVGCDHLSAAFDASWGVLMRAADHRAVASAPV